MARRTGSLLCLLLLDAIAHVDLLEFEAMRDFPFLPHLASNTAKLQLGSTRRLEAVFLKSTLNRDATLRLRGGQKRNHKILGSSLASKRRKASGPQSCGPPPIIIALVPLTDSADADEAQRRIVSSCFEDSKQNDREGPSWTLERRPVTIALPGKCGGGGKRRATFVALSGLDPMAMLDCLKVADCAVLLHAGAELPATSSATKYAPGNSFTSQPGAWGGNAIALLRAQGLPAIAVGAMACEEMSPAAKMTLRRARAKLLAAESLGEEQELRSYDLWDSAQLFAMLRTLTERRLKGPSWREPYPYILGVSCGYDRASAMLAVRGYLSGKPLSANQLIHITGVGTFAADRIVSAVDPCPARAGAWTVHGSSMARDKAMAAQGGEESGVDGGGVEEDDKVVLSQREEDKAEALDSRPEDVGEEEEEEEGEGGEEGAAGEGKLGEMEGGESEGEEEERGGGGEGAEKKVGWQAKRERYFADWEEAAQSESETEEEEGEKGRGGVGGKGTRAGGGDVTVDAAEREGEGEDTAKEVDAVKRLLRQRKVAKKLEALAQTESCWRPVVHSKLEAVLDDRDDIGGREVFRPAAQNETETEGGGGRQSEEEEEEEEDGVVLGQRRMGNKGGKAERRLRAQLRGDEWEFLEGLDLLGEGEDGARERKEYEEARRAAEDEVLFADEVDIPTDKTVQRRFAKYAPLHDLSRCSVDPSADLPGEYKRIFQFGNFRGAYRRALRAARVFHAEASSGRVRAAMPGEFVEVQLRCAGEGFGDLVEAKLGRGEAVVVSGMLRHENKRGVLNVEVRRVASVGEGEAVQSKHHLEFHFGFRREPARPLFSTAVAGSAARGGQLKYLMRRFLPSDTPTAASLLAHTAYPGTPVLAFRPRDGRLLATGGVVDMDSDRIVLKRAVLTGDPFRMYKRTVVVRWMFFFASDVRLLAGAQLWTKHGRTGEVMEPLGTHGLMKCVMSDSITHKDTVCLSLYKRVFPKSLQAG